MIEALGLPLIFFFGITLGIIASRISRSSSLEKSDRIIIGALGALFLTILLVTLTLNPGLALVLLSAWLAIAAIVFLVWMIAVSQDKPRRYSREKPLPERRLR